MYANVFFSNSKFKKNLEDKKVSTSVGDEGGFAPSLASDEEAIEIIMKSITSSGFEPGDDISICLDVAANELKKPKNVEYFLNLIKNIQLSLLRILFQKMIGIIGKN